jgi:hypothetical protein
MSLKSDTLVHIDRFRTKPASELAEDDGLMCLTSVQSISTDTVKGCKLYRIEPWEGVTHLIRISTRSGNEILAGLGQRFYVEGEGFILADYIKTGDELVGYASGVMVIDEVVNVAEVDADFSLELVDVATARPGVPFCVSRGGYGLFTTPV